MSFLAFFPLFFEWLFLFFGAAILAIIEVITYSFRQMRGYQHTGVLGVLILASPFAFLESFS